MSRSCLAYNARTHKRWRAAWHIHTHAFGERTAWHTRTHMRWTYSGHTRTHAVNVQRDTHACMRCMYSVTHMHKVMREIYWWVTHTRMSIKATALPALSKNKDGDNVLRCRTSVWTLQTEVWRLLPHSSRVHVMYFLICNLIIKKMTRRLINLPASLNWVKQLRCVSDYAVVVVMMVLVMMVRVVMMVDSGNNCRWRWRCLLTQQIFAIYSCIGN